MNLTEIPDRFNDSEELEEFMTRPTPALVQAMLRVDGDVMVLGVGGKMGPTLARLAKRAMDEAQIDNRVIGVSRFSNPDHQRQLERFGVETIPCDLLNPEEVGALPQVPNIIFLVGMKFGTTGGEAQTWAINTITPANVCRHFKQSRIVALSTGNVYPLTPVDSGGPNETDPVGPIGEYAQSALARERVFEYFSVANGIPMTVVRLNYAIDLRYGVLLDLAQKGKQQSKIDLSMGFANVIWQGDANERILRCLEHCASPPEVLNLTGDEVLSVRNLAEKIGERLGVAPVFVGDEATNALLSDASKSREWFGNPNVTIDRMIEWVVCWIEHGGETFGKLTHFEVRDGKF